jgi:hypothetical protein
MTTYDAGSYTSLVAELLAVGFILMGDSEDPDRFGNRQLLLRRNETRIRLVCDRSQWFIEVAAPNSDDWFAPVVWQALLDDQLPPDQMPSDQEQATLVNTRLRDTDTVCHDEPDNLAERLKVWQAARAAARRARPLDD